MAVLKTLSIIKPDATSRNITGKINAMIEDADLRIVAQRRIRLTREQVESFYIAHKKRAFYEELCDYMSSGPVIVQVLEAEDAIDKYRRVMGATDPAEAQTGTIRKAFALTVQQNSVHGSDSPETADWEIRFF
ncbi:MAG: nucleoside-diphosphate kinase, partial [Rhodospirillales bacterium]